MLLVVDVVISSKLETEHIYIQGSSNYNYSEVLFISDYVV